MKRESYFSLLSASVKKEVEKLGLRRVLVGFSGGPDSVIVLYILKYIGVDVLALHCNFHLRGEESNRDADFVSQFCADNGIPLETIDFDVESYRKGKTGRSVEMACRDLRHHWFREKLKETKRERIVTGHNADDNIETFLLNALRGSGTRGLRGMRNDNGILWRPLLKFHRQEILSCLKEKELQFVVDSTNLESDFRRNFLRNKIIPLLKDEWKGFDTSLDKTINNLNSENLIVEKTLEDAMPLNWEPLRVEKILDFPAPLLLIKRYIEPMGPYTTTPAEIMASIQAAKPHTRNWKLQKGTVRLQGNKLFIY